MGIRELAFEAFNAFEEPQIKENIKFDSLTIGFLAVFFYNVACGRTFRGSRRIEGMIRDFLSELDKQPGDWFTLKELCQKVLLSPLCQENGLIPPVDGFPKFFGSRQTAQR